MHLYTVFVSTGLVLQALLLEMKTIWLPTTKLTWAHLTETQTSQVALNLLWVSVVDWNPQSSWQFPLITTVFEGLYIFNFIKRTLWCLLLQMEYSAQIFMLVLAYTQARQNLEIGGWWILRKNMWFNKFRSQTEAIAVVRCPLMYKETVTNCAITCSHQTQNWFCKPDWFLVLPTVCLNPSLKGRRCGQTFGFQVIYWITSASGQEALSIHLPRRHLIPQHFKSVTVSRVQLPREKLQCSSVRKLLLRDMWQYISLITRQLLYMCAKCRCLVQVSQKHFVHPVLFQHLLLTMACSWLESYPFTWPVQGLQQFIFLVNFFSTHQRYGCFIAQCKKSIPVKSLLNNCWVACNENEKQTEVWFGSDFQEKRGNRKHLSATGVSPCVKKTLIYHDKHITPNLSGSTDKQGMWLPAPLSCIQLKLRQSSKQRRETLWDYYITTDWVVLRTKELDACVKHCCSELFLDTCYLVACCQWPGQNIMILQFYWE